MSTTPHQPSDPAVSAHAAGADIPPPDGAAPAAARADGEQAAGIETSAQASSSSWPYLLMAMTLVVIDQITKYLVIDHFEYAERLPVIPGFFDLTLLYNPGAAFSFLASHGGWQRWFFTLIAVAVSSLLVYMLVRHRGSTMFNTALGLVLGGAVGNLIDRLVLGHVTDFLLFYQGDWSFPAFNVADCAITVGATLWILDELLQSWRNRRRTSTPN